MSGTESSAWPASAGAAAQVFVADVERPRPSGDDLHHLAHVLRLRRGETVVAADGAGRWRTCRFGAGDDPGAALVPVGDPVMCPRRPPAVTVAFVPVKGDRPEWVVQKLTECGVDRIAVVRSARSVVRWDGQRASAAVDRLRRVARQAAAQSRRAWLPEVSGVHTLAELAGGLASGDPPVRLALAQPGGAPPTLAAPAVAVGPEGGWEPAELAAAGRTVGLGDGVLRAETAALAVGILLCAQRDGLVASRLPGGPDLHDQEDACNRHAE